MFSVKIRPQIFSIREMDFLNSKGFSPDKIYKVVAVVESKLLLVDEDSGEMVELFPRNCIYVR